jgi:hypothetical protein
MVPKTTAGMRIKKKINLIKDSNTGCLDCRQTH